jgi:hypothetical protein
MRSNDRFLIAIVIGVVALVAVAFAVALSRPEPTYRGDDTPEAAVHNYLLALKLKDFPRAWGYLSPALPGYPPNAEAFADDITEKSWLIEFANVEIGVDGADVTGNLAVVEVVRTNFFNNGLFDSGQNSNIFNVKAQREDGVWKLIHGDEYWWYCWDEAREDCKRGALATPEKVAP